jgi:hypothetical protein
MEAALAPVVPTLVQLDIGCGKNKKPGFIGVDAIQMEGVDIVCDLSKGVWPWGTGSVDEVHCSHFIEHLTNLDGKFERVHFFNELHRVLKVGAKATLIFPHWASTRYYGDPTHKEPFSEMGFYYLSADWRATQAPHTDVRWAPSIYSCDFEAVWGYAMRQDLITKAVEYQQFAMANYKEAITDIMATLTKKQPLGELK